MRHIFPASTASLYMGLREMFVFNFKGSDEAISHTFSKQKKDTRESPRFQEIQEASSCKNSMAGSFSICESVKNYTFLSHEATVPGPFCGHWWQAPLSEVALQPKRWGWVKLDLNVTFLRGLKLGGFFLT